MKSLFQCSSCGSQTHSSPFFCKLQGQQVCSLYSMPDIPSSVRIWKGDLRLIWCKGHLISSKPLLTHAINRPGGCTQVGLRGWGEAANPRTVGSLALLITITYNYNLKKFLITLLFICFCIFSDYSINFSIFFLLLPFYVCCTVWSSGGFVKLLYTSTSIYVTHKNIKSCSPYFNVWDFTCYFTLQKKCKHSFVVLRPWCPSKTQIKHGLLLKSSRLRTWFGLVMDWPAILNLLFLQLCNYKTRLKFTVLFHSTVLATKQCWTML